MLGILTTWNQPCGLATYAANLVRHLDNYIILGEEASTRADDSIRCWRRGADNYEKLKEVVKEHGIKTLFLNCHYRFFNKHFFEALRSLDVRVVSLIHNPFTLDEDLAGLIEVSDEVIVHTSENRVEVIANGASPDKVRVIEHGVEVLSGKSREEARAELGLSTDKNIVVSFGFVQPHKGIEHVIQALPGVDCEFYVVGGAHEEDPNSKRYLEFLGAKAGELGVARRVHFLDEFVSEQKVNNYLIASDVVVMNYQSNYYEASGAVAKALGAGRAVIASTAPCFARLQDAVFHTTTGYPLDMALKLVLGNKTLKASLEQGARDWAEKYSWEKVSKEFFGARQMEKKASILFQNRPNVYTQRGGDTVFMDNLAAGLRSRGFEVDIKPERVSDYSGYDIVHLFNFATPELTETYAKDCVKAGKEYVVTALYEDRPAFFNQMYAAFDVAREGFTRNVQEEVSKVAPAPRWENSWTAEHAAALLATGATEAQALRRDYPGAKVFTARVGCELGARGVGAELFEGEFGVKEYILCVGRVETRKNQLLLLKALENDDLPVVFVDGGFTYQPEYLELCKNFKRPGRIIFTGKLTDQQLASAYAGAKVHALPSWYELPGLVSLEAARYGTNVVVSNNGTSKDYFGQEAFYCDPADPQSIRNAVLAAYYAPPRAGLKDLAESVTWAQATEDVVEVYSQVAKVKNSAIRDINLATINTQATARAIQTVKVDTDVDDKALRLLDQGDKLAREGVSEKAIENYQEALTISPRSVRAYRSIGAVYLANSQLEAAADAFDHALSLSSRDARALAGKASIQLSKGDIDQAFSNFQLASESDPEDLAVILLFLNSAFLSGRYSELEKCLKGYLERNPSDSNMRYCLAGCLYKQGRELEAKAAIKLYLVHGGDHAKAEELLGQFGSPEPTSQENELLAELQELKAQGKFDEVIKKIESCPVNMSAPVKDRVYVMLGESLALVGDFSKAREQFNSIDKTSAAWPKAQTGLGAIAASEESWAEAESLFNTALEVSPNLDSALAGLGLCLSMKGERDKAFKYFSRALDTNPENLRALLGVIELGYSCGELSTIERHLNEYLELHPANLNMLYAKAGCLYSQGRNDECLETLAIIKTFEPNHEMALELEKAATRQVG